MLTPTHVCENMNKAYDILLSACLFTSAGR